MNTRAFIIGNGLSRKGIDLARLNGTTYGCNALYRNFSPDYLVAVDVPMQKQILESGYHENNQCLFKVSSRPGRIPHWGEHPNITPYKNEVSKPRNSGVSAIWWALKHGHREIILLGMDLRSHRGHANIYAGSKGYEDQNKNPPQLPGTVVDRLNLIITRNTRVTWWRLIDPYCQKLKTPNLNQVTEFRNEWYNKPPTAASYER